MKLRRTTALGMCILCFFVAGCGGEHTVYLEDAGTQDLTESVTEQTAETQSEEHMQSAKEALCYVYVCGAVKCPGVYALKEDSRIYEAVAMAGGFCEDARQDAVNQAEMVLDGQMVYIPTIEEEYGNGTTEGERMETPDDGRINLNTASAEQLMTLPGIGRSKAESIINYRKEHGAFASAADVMNVEGIKEGIYNRMKDSIKVN